MYCMFIYINSSRELDLLDICFHSYDCLSFILFRELSALRGGTSNQTDNFVTVQR